MSNTKNKIFKIFIIVFLVVVALIIHKFWPNLKTEPAINFIPSDQKPPHFPENIELFGLKEILQNYEIKDGNKIQSVRQFVSALLPENLYNQYKIYLLTRGWSIVEDSNNNPTKMVFYANKENESATVYIEKVHKDLSGKNYDAVVTLYFFNDIK